MQSSRTGPNLNFKLRWIHDVRLAQLSSDSIRPRPRQRPRSCGRLPMTHRIIETADAKRLRAYATRLMAFALKAVSDGDMDFAERLTARASKCLDDAQATEAS